MLILAIYSAIVATIFLLIFRRPAAALIMSTNIFTLKQWSTAASPLLSKMPLLTNFIAGSLVLLAVLLQIFRGNINRPLYPKEGWLTAALFSYSLITIGWAPDYATSARNWTDGFPYVITIIFLASLTIQKIEDLHVAFSGILVIGSILAALLLFTVTWQGRGIVLGKNSFGESLGGNPLTVGLLGGTLVILAILYRFPRKSLLLNFIKFTALIVGFALAVRSGSRGQMGGMVLVAGFLWIVASPSKNLIKPLFGVLFCTGLVFVAKIVIDFYWQGDKRFNSHMLQGDYAGRLHVAMTLLDKWFDSPFSILFGLGSSASYDILGIYPHIVPLEVLGEEGVIGFFILCVIIIGTVIKALRSLRLTTDPEYRILLACVTGLWFYSFLLINKQGSLLLSQDFFFYSILLAKFGQLVAEKRQIKLS